MDNLVFNRLIFSYCGEIMEGIWNPFLPKALNGILTNKSKKLG